MKIKSLLVGVSCMISGSVYAGATEGKVGAVFVHVFNDAVVFGMQPTSSGFASCATSSRYAVTTSAQQGRNVLSTILAAKAANQTIQVVGKGTCAVNPDAEDVNYIVVY
jgi:hypothetical protein